MAVKIIKTQTDTTQIDHNDLANIGINTHQQLDEIVDEVSLARDGKNTLDQRIDDDINSLQTQIDDVSLEIQEARGNAPVLDGRLDDIETTLAQKYEKPADGIPISDLDPTVMESISHWKSPVATVNDLPTTSNFDGDARVVLENGSIYIWVNNAWKQISGSGGSGGSGSSTGNDLYVGKNVTVEYQYDNDNMLIKEITTGDINRVKDYTYDDDGNITQIIMVEDGQTYTQTFEYNNGNISRVVNNGVDLFFAAASSGYVGVTATDFNNLQVNLMKTNFKIDSLSNATRNSMKNMFVDVFNDTNGVDASQSDFTFDATRKSIKGTIVITTPETIDYYPSKVLLCVDYIGDIDFYVSRDGTNWTQVYPDTICDISNQPYSNLLTVKFIMQADAELSAYALAWR
jgi:hypothetical protein